MLSEVVKVATEIFSGDYYSVMRCAVFTTFSVSEKTLLYLPLLVFLVCEESNTVGGWHSHSL